MKRVGRRLLGLLLAVSAVLLLLRFGGGGRMDGLARAVGESEALVTALLEAELGRHGASGPAEQLTGLSALVVRQSAVLRGGRDGLWTLPQALASAKGLTRTDEIFITRAEDGNQTEEEQPIPDEPGTVDTVERTLVPVATQSYASANGVYIYNRTDYDLDVASLMAEKLTQTIGEEEPQVLIIHTHGSEAYNPTAEDAYVASDPSRTTDTRYNMVRVGEELTGVLEAAGIGVLHDTTLYDYPSYNESYANSMKGIEEALAAYPTIRIVLDLHRDALIGSSGTVYKAVTEVDGEKTAQVLLVVGSDAGGQEHPNWRENLKLAIRIQEELGDRYPTLARPMTLRTSRFNQQATTGSLLVEIGCNGNTLTEALRAVRYFGDALAAVLKEIQT
ncbi:MAG TPA: stage II sporulation protein P [Oscillospiraceae bacterium]|nr:stage II sporulation protein P [Oscillospiraceae bacterium]